MPANSDIIGGAATGRLFGMLIERTEALREETGELKRVVGDLRELHASMNSSLLTINRRADTLEAADARYDAKATLLEPRVKILEEWREARHRTTMVVATIVGGCSGALANGLIKLIALATGSH